MNFEDVETRKRNLQSMDNSINDSVQSKIVKTYLAASPGGDVIPLPPWRLGG